VTSADFNFIYDIFLGQESKPLKAKEFGTISDLLLGYRQSGRNLWGEFAKLMCDLFMD